MRTILVLMTAVLCLQDTDSLIRNLGSEDPDVRDRAFAELRKLGDKARSALEAATKGRDAETTSRAQTLLRTLDIERKIGPALRKAIPGIVDRLAEGGAPVWTKVFLEAAAFDNDFKLRHPELTRHDLAPLAADAVMGATRRQRGSVFRILYDRRVPVDEKRVISLLVESNRMRDAGRLGVVFRTRDALPELARFDNPDLLGRYKESVADPLLRLMLKHEDKWVRERTAKVAGDLLARNLIPELRALLKDKENFVQSAAAKALGLMRDKEAGPGILDLLRSEYFLHKTDAVLALARIGNKDVLPYLVERIESKNAPERMNGVNGLAELNATDQANKIAPLLQDPDSGVRRSAVRALGRWKAVEQYDAMRRLWRDPSKEVRRELAAALVACKGDDSIPDVFKLFSHTTDYSEIRDMLPALRKLDRTKMLDTLNLYLKSDFSHIRKNAAEVTGLLGIRDATPALVGLLADRNARVRREAVKALGRLNLRKEIPTVRKLLRDKDLNVQYEALLALGQLGARDALLDVAKDSDPEGLEFRVSLTGLLEMGEKQAIPILEAHLHKREARHRILLATPACRLGSKTAGREVFELYRVGFGSLFPLNFLGNPDGMKKLNQIRLKEDRNPTQREWIQWIGEQSGLRVDLPDTVLRWVDTRLDSTHAIGREEGRVRYGHFRETTALHVLERICHQTLIEAIVEKDRIRFVDRGTAIDYWRTRLPR